MLGDAVLQSMTAEHCIGYAVRLVDSIADSAAKYESQVTVSRVLFTGNPKYTYINYIYRVAYVLSWV